MIETYLMRVIISAFLLGILIERWHRDYMILRLYDLETRDFFNSSDVVFYKNHFPYSPSNSTSLSLSSQDPTYLIAYDDIFLDLHSGASKVRASDVVLSTGIDGVDSGVRGSDMDDTSMSTPLNGVDSSRSQVGNTRSKTSYDVGVRCNHKER